MRVLFCGSGKFAVPSLRAILASEHELVGIVTQPARRAGRGGKLRPTPVTEAARAAGLEASETPNINADESVAAVRALRPDVICVADFGQMIREPVRRAACLDAFNLHASLLPALRGAAPINWAIIRGHKCTGVTTFSLVDRMDAGPVYLQAATEIKPDETAEELRETVAQLGAELVSNTLAALASGSAEPRPQDESLATLAPLLKKSDGLIDWSAEAAAVRNLIHGTWPWPGGQAVFRRADGGETAVAIARAAVAEGPAAGEPGGVDRDLLVATGSGRMRILQIRPAGKRIMCWRDFVNGYHVSEGDRFVRPEA